MNKQTFLLPQVVTIKLDLSQTKQPLAITYYSDCVFEPFIYKFKESQFEIVDNKQLRINFNFLLEEIKNQPKILDNIGVLKIEKVQRFGILVTKQKQGIFVSLID